jgi:hypothetical protein
MAVDLGGNLVVAHGEFEDLGQAAGNGDDGHLAFPGLAQPALLGKLLHVTGPFAGRIAPVEHQPGVAGQQGQEQNNETDEPDEPVLGAGAPADGVDAT